MQQLIVIFHLEAELHPIDASLLRGAVASCYPELALLHNHMNEGYRYKTPLVQYKVISNKALIIGMNEGADELKKIVFSQTRFMLGEKIVRVLEREIISRGIPFGPVNQDIAYRFLTPWMALNEDNYTRYVQSSSVHHRDLLKKILIGNLLALSKGLDYTVSEQINVSRMQLGEQKIGIKGNPMIGFIGQFTANFEIPELWGIGKSTSRGFGTVAHT